MENEDSWPCGGTFVQVPNVVPDFKQFEADAKAAGCDGAYTRRVYERRKNSKMYANSKYLVGISDGVSDLNPATPMTRLVIERRDKKPIHEWKDIECIKNHFVGEDCDAFQLYPSRLSGIDPDNRYTLWCFTDGMQPA